MKLKVKIIILRLSNGVGGLLKLPSHNAREITRVKIYMLNWYPDKVVCIVSYDSHGDTILVFQTSIDQYIEKKKRSELINILHLLIRFSIIIDILHFLTTFF